MAHLALLQDGGADLAGHHRRDAVGTDHEAGREVSRVGAGPDPDAGHAARAVAEHVGDPGLVEDVRAGLGGGVHEHPVEQVAARGVERADAGAGPDRDPDGVVLAVVEGDDRDRRRTGPGDPRQQAPAGQLEHPGAHQPVRGERVGAVPAPVQQRDPEAGPGQQHRGGGAGDPGAHDDDVVVLHDTSALSRAANSPVHRWETTSSAPNRAPSMNVESRRCWNHCPTV